MIPISDSPPRHTTPWVNYTLIMVSALAFLFELSLGPDLDGFITRWGVTPRVIMASLQGDPRAPSGGLLTLITAMFLHGGWLHVIGNMLFLWIFGDNVEDRLGHVSYLAFYFACGIGASLSQVFIYPTSTVPMIGASGAIAGVLGAYIFLYPRASVTVLLPLFIILIPITVPAVIVLGFWFVTQLLNGLASITTAASATGGVGYWAHIGGFIIGALLLVIWPKKPAPLAAPRYPRATDRPSGASGVFGRLLALAGTVIDMLLIVRLVVVVLGLHTWLDLAAIMVALSDPLIQPFTFIPALRIGTSVIELYTIVALFVYHLVLSLLTGAVSASAGRGREFIDRRPL